MAHFIILVAKLKGDESIEAPGSILQLPQPFHMINAMPVLFYMPVQYCRITIHPGIVCRFMYLQPTISVDFVMANLLPYLRMENFCASAGNRIKSRGFQVVYSFVHSHLRFSKHVIKFNCGKPFNVKVWTMCFNLQK